MGHSRKKLPGITDADSFCDERSGHNSCPSFTGNQGTFAFRSGLQDLLTVVDPCGKGLDSVLGEDVFIEILRVAKNLRSNHAE